MQSQIVFRISIIIKTSYTKSDRKMLISHCSIFNTRMFYLIIQCHTQLFVLKQYILLKHVSVTVITIFQSSLDTTGTSPVIFQIHCDEAGMPACTTCRHLLVVTYQQALQYLLASSVHISEWSVVMNGKWWSLDLHCLLKAVELPETKRVHYSHSRKHALAMSKSFHSFSLTQ